MPQTKRSGQVIAKEPNVETCRKWLVRIFLRRVAGKKKYASKVVHGTRKQAEQVLRSMLTQHDAGKFVPKVRQTVDEYLDLWLKDMAPVTRKARTLKDDTNKIRLYVRPYLGTHKLGDLSPMDIQAWIRQLQAKGLSPKTIRLAKTLCAEALSAAVHPYGLLPFNPAQGVKTPTIRKGEKVVWTGHQTLQFLKAAEGDRLEALYTLMVASGLRPGEALGLQRRDYDPVTGAIRINRVLIREAGGEGGYRLYYDEDPKTDNSRRTIFLTQRARRLLERHLQASEFMESASPIFHNRHGGPLDEHNVSKKSFKPLCAKAQVPVLRFYDLRHTFASLMHDAGVDMKDYGSMMGHSSITVTADVYTHLPSQRQRQVVERFDQYLEALNGEPEPARLPAIPSEHVD